MTSKPTKDSSRSQEAHIYMTPAMKKDLARLARQSHRSVNGQILHYVQRGLTEDLGTANEH